MVKDSGQSTEKFFITQKIIQEKNEEYIKNIEKKRKQEALRVRFLKSSRLTKTNSLWERIKQWLRLK